MTLETLDDLLVHELRDLINAEKQLVRALPKLIKAATNEALGEALTDHLAETRTHVIRLEECLGLLGVSTRGSICCQHGLKCIGRARLMPGHRRFDHGCHTAKRDPA